MDEDNHTTTCLYVPTAEMITGNASTTPGYCSEICDASQTTFPAIRAALLDIFNFEIVLFLLNLRKRKETLNHA